jgi:hypothetical protein
MDEEMPAGQGSRLRVAEALAHTARISKSWVSHRKRASGIRRCLRRRARGRARTERFDLTIIGEPAQAPLLLLD